MLNNYIELKFDKLITNLVGNKLGRTTYKNQVQGKIDFDKMNIITFDDAIEDVAISFFQGFCHELVEAHGKKEVNKIIEVQSIHQDIMNKFKKTLTI